MKFGALDRAPVESGVIMPRSHAQMRSALAFAAAAALVLAAAGCKSNKEDPIAIPLQAPPRQEAPAPTGDVLSAPTLSSAVEAARAKMTGDKTPSEGGLLLAQWGASNLSWEDVDLPRPESSLALVAERGKRLCERGVIFEIHAELVGKVWRGALTRDGRTLRFLAVRGVGSLAPRAQGRFCGVVTGQYEFLGKKVVEVVGMFDLPDNRRPPLPTTPSAAIGDGPRPGGRGAKPGTSAAATGSPAASGRSISSSL